MDDVSESYIRIASCSIVLFDFIQTIPATLRLYRESWGDRKTILIACAFAIARYMTIASVTTASFGWFIGSFNGEQCSHLHLVPIITQLLACLGIESIIFIKVYLISKRAPFVLMILGLLAFFAFPMQIFGSFYRRHSEDLISFPMGVLLTIIFTAILEDGRCMSQVHGKWGLYDSGMVYFASNFIFSTSACLLSIGSIYSQTKNSPLSSLARTLYGHGVPILAAISTVTLVSLLGSLGVKGFKDLGWTLPNALIVIMAQHLALSTFDLTSIGRGIERPPKLTQRNFEGVGLGGGRKSSQIELTGIKIQTETTTQMNSEDAEDARYSRAASSQQQSNPRRHSSITEVEETDDEKFSGRWPEGTSISNTTRYPHRTPHGKF